MKTSSTWSTNRIITAGICLILVLFQAEMGYAAILNCTQINMSELDGLTAEQNKLYNEKGYFEPVKTYAEQIEQRFKDEDMQQFGYICPEVEGYGNLDGIKLADGFFSAYRNQFADSIQKMFTNPSSNTSLTSIALAKFNEYSQKQDMLCGVFHYYLFTNVEQQEESRGTSADRAQIQMTTRYIECKEVLEKAVDESESLMMSHIKSTSAQKRATTLVEKYKAINSQMRDLNTSFARMYAFFQTFANKLLFKADKQMIGF